MYFFADICTTTFSAKGTANPIYSGPVMNLVECAKNLYPDIEPQPVVCLESDAWYGLIIIGEYIDRQTDIDMFY